MAAKRPLVINVNYAQLRPDTDPTTVEPAVAEARRPLRLQFDEPLPGALLTAAAETLRRYPEIAFRAYFRYGPVADPTLQWLSEFEHVEHLALDIRSATSFDALARFTRLRSLGSARPPQRSPRWRFFESFPNFGRSGWRAMLETSTRYAMLRA